MIFSPALHGIRLYGIGHAMVDLYAVLPPCSVLPFPLKVEKAIHLDESEMNVLVWDVHALCKNSQSKTALFCKTAGGTVANILRTAARLGAVCFFSGSTGMDKEGRRDTDAFFFQEECAKVRVQAHLVSRTGHTGRCLAVYPEQSPKKAIAASPSAARSIETKQVSENEIMGAHCIVIEGMIFFNAAVSERIIELCSKYKKLLAVDLASPFVAEATLAALARAVKNNLIGPNQLLIFANEREYTAIQTTAQSAKDYLLQHGAVIIEKRAEKGARLYWHKAILEEKVSVQAVIDDTGAGDAFAGGFLQCLLAEYTTAPQKLVYARMTENILRTCLSAGNKSAAAVLGNYGCTLAIKS